MYNGEMKLDALLEAVLFYNADSMKKPALEGILGCSTEDLQSAIEELRKRLSGGIVLLEEGDELKLATSSEASEIITTLRKEELSRDLGKAGTETLAIVAYRAPISKAHIDFIRGVNCASILRNLRIRGLVKKVPNPEDSRGYLYEPSLELLQYLGITKKSDLPGFKEANEQISAFFAKEE